MLVNDPLTFLNKALFPWGEGSMVGPSDSLNYQTRCGDRDQSWSSHVVGHSEWVLLTKSWHCLGWWSYFMTPPVICQYLVEFPNCFFGGRVYELIKLPPCIHVIFLPYPATLECFSSTTSTSRHKGRVFNGKWRSNSCRRCLWTRLGFQTS